MAVQELTEEMIAELARNVAGGKMESTGLGFLGADGDRVEALKEKHRGDAEPFNRDILRDWRNRNGDDDYQVQKLAVQLHKAAAKAAYINPRKIKDILGVSKEQAEKLETAFTSDKDLTDAMVNNLAQFLTSEEKLRKLAMNGFGMRRHVVELHVDNYRKINDAAYHLLSEWLNSKATRVVAYREICAALTAADLDELIQELK